MLNARCVNAVVVAQRVPLARLALKHRLPGMFPFKENVEAGGL